MGDIIHHTTKHVKLFVAVLSARCEHSKFQMAEEWLAQPEWLHQPGTCIAVSSGSIQS